MKKIILVLLLMATTVGATDFYINNENNFVWVTHTSNLDSARVRFFLHNISNKVDSVKLLPDLTINVDSMTVLADSFSLDNIGQHLVQIVYYPHGGTQDTFIADVINTSDLATSGAGSEAETLIVLASTDSTEIENASIVVRTLNQSSVKAIGSGTDANGIEIFELSVASYFVGFTHNNYTYQTDTITVASGGGTDTVFMAQFSPSAPARRGGSVIYGWTADVLGDTIEGAVLHVNPVNISGISWKDSVGVWVFLSEQTTKSNSSGYFELEVYRSNYLTGVDKSGTETSDTLKYDIWLKKSGYLSPKLTEQYITTDSTRVGH